MLFVRHRKVLACFSLGFLTGSVALMATSRTSISWSGPASQPDNTVTFTRHIAPIIFEHCATCHRPGEAAPFSLLTYDDVRRHATQIALATTTRYMPPWKPEAAYGTFEGERRLSDEHIRLIRQWVDGGLVEGDANDLPRAPTWPAGWQLGQP